MHEGPGRGLVDVLLDRDKLAARLAQLEEHIGVVAAVAGEAVDLVQDDDVDVTGLLDAVHHAQEVGAVRGLGRFPPVKVLVDHVGPQFGRPAETGISLGGQGACKIGTNFYPRKRSRRSDTESSRGCA
ncbi:MAG TPA: hypothetical protein VMV22_05525 [Acidimicrobiales bacterium]|nr:hypothetical protein [Acidimicrobiales bacterium]